jgi:hypothetical protein
VADYEITLSSSGVSSPQNLDYRSSKFISFAVTGSSSGTFSYVIEGTLDDVTQEPAAAITWWPMSSATTANSSLNLYQGPLAAMRINASAVSSATLTLRILQGIGW